MQEMWETLPDPRFSLCVNPWVGFNPWIRFIPWVREIPWRTTWLHSFPVFLPGKFCGQRSLVGYSPEGHKESHTTEWLSTDWLTDFSISGYKEDSNYMGRVESPRYCVVEHESFSVTRWESVAPAGYQTWIPVMSTWWLGSKIASFLPSSQVSVNLMLFTLVWIICINYESLLHALCITSWLLSSRMQSASVSTWPFLKLSVHLAQSGCLDFCPSHKIGQLAWMNEWMNVQPPPAQFFFIVIYLHWVLVVALRIFDLPGGLRDLLLCYARSFLVGGSSSLARDRTQAPLCWEHGVLATGLPGMSLLHSSEELKLNVCGSMVNSIKHYDIIASNSITFK